VRTSSVTSYSSIASGDLAQVDQQRGTGAAGHGDVRQSEHGGLAAVGRERGKASAVQVVQAGVLDGAQPDPALAEDQEAVPVPAPAEGIRDVIPYGFGVLVIRGDEQHLAGLRRRQHRVRHS
jgi:hypothetical protein